MIRANSEILVFAVYMLNVVDSILIDEAASFFYQLNLVDPASSHTLVLKIKPCMSKCFVFVILDCRRLIITVIVSLKLLFRWIPVVILELKHAKIKCIFFCIWLRYYFFQIKMFRHCGWFIVMFLERDIQRDNSFKFLTYQLFSSVLDYWGIDG